MRTVIAWILAPFRRAAERVTNRLVRKLILLFTSIIILVVVSLSLISYKRIESLSIESSISSNTSNLKLVHGNFRKYFAEMEQLTIPLLQYEEVLSALHNEQDDYLSKLYLENYLKGLFYSRPDIDGVYLYIIDFGKYYYISRQEKEIKVRVVENAGIIGTDWFKRALASPRNHYVESMLNRPYTGYSINTDSTFMAFHRTLRALTSRQPKAVLSVYFNPSVRDEIIGDIPVQPGEHVAFYNAEQVPFYRDDADFYEALGQENLLHRPEAQAVEEPSSSSISGEKYMIFADRDEESGWTLAKYVPNKEIYKAARSNTGMSMVTGLIFLLFATLLVTFTSNEITKPLKRLSRKMNAFGEGRFDVELEVTGRDEISRLSHQFNMMVTRTNELINERYKMQLVEKSAILKALEAEINPHFLYNALQAISTKALKSGMYDITDMVDALALSLRYCISGKERVRLQDEIQHIEHYLTIQKARFGDRLQVQYELAPDTSELEIPKLSVQSLVENCIKHALEKIPDPVTVSIQSFLEGRYIVISVSDDGPGIPSGKLERIRESFHVEWVDRETDSIGLKNLSDRLKLIYGEESRLDIQSDGNGTQMRIIIPRERGNADVSSLNNG